MRYGVFCELEVLHDFFVNSGDIVFEALGHRRTHTAFQQYSADTFLRISPTRNTVSVLSGHKLVYKSTGRGFIIGVQLDDSALDDRPAIPPGPDFRLSFSLSIVDPLFFNYSAIPEHTGSIFRFGNESGNEMAGGRHLTAPVAAYDTARRYSASDLYSEPSGNTVNLFRAIRDTGPAGAPVTADWVRVPANTHDPAATYTTGAIVLSANELFEALVDGPGTDLTIATDWDPAGTLANQYVSRADLVDLKPHVFDMDLTAGAVPEATARVFRPGQATEVYEQSFSAESGNLTRVQLDLRHLAAGRYSLVFLDGGLAPIPGLGGDIYVDSEAFARRWFGVIEIGQGSGDLALLDGTGALRSPNYSLRFLNQATRWRYLFPETQTVGAGSDVSAEDAAGRILLSDDSHPLTRYGTGLRLRADNIATPGASEQVLLPEPEANRIRKENSQWFSEIQMSNYPPLT